MGKYILVYGNRRYVACKKLGLQTIQAIDINTKEMKKIPIDEISQLDNIRTNIEKDQLSELMVNISHNGLLHPVGVTTNAKLDDVEYLILNASENIFRKDITPVEFGRVCRRLMDDHDMTVSEIASRYGCGKSKITSALQIYDGIPEEHKDTVGYMMATREKKGKVSAAVAKSIIEKHITKEEKGFLFEFARKNEISVSTLRVIMELVGSGLSVSEAVKEYPNYVVKHVELLLDKEKHDRLMATHPEKPFKRVLLSILRKEIIPVNGLFPRFKKVNN